MSSLLNGLSSLGSGVATFAGTAGIEAQRATLAQQQTILADQLATTRETGLQASAGVIAAAAADKQQAATSANLATSEAGANARNAASIAGTSANTRATIAGEMARTQATINAPPETIKLLKALGVELPGVTTPGSGSASATATPAVSGGDTGGAPSGTATSDATTPAPSSAASGSPSSVTDNPIVRKALGMPAMGSPEATRAAIAKDVNSDPAFKYKTDGQKAAETEIRVAVAEGKMTDPGSREAMAQGIASYQIAPLSGFSLTKPGGPETMARAIQINPDYQESRYPEVNKGMSAFGSGKQGDIIRANNVGVQHLDVLDQAGQALANGNVQVLNSLKNTFQQQFGSPEPTTFSGLKQIVGTEIEKAVAGGIGSASDRDRIMKALDGANSPAQLKAITGGFRSLMVGQLSGLKSQYEDATGFKTGPFAFESKLVPATIKALGLHSGNATTAAPSSAPVVPGANPDVTKLWGQ